MCPPRTRSHGFGQESLSFWRLFLWGVSVSGRVCLSVRAVGLSVCLAGLLGCLSGWLEWYLAVWISAARAARYQEEESRTADKRPAQKTLQRGNQFLQRKALIQVPLFTCLHSVCLFTERVNMYVNMNVCMLCTQVPKASYSSFFFYYDLHGFTSCLLVCVFHDIFIHLSVSTWSLIDLLQKLHSKASSFYEYSPISRSEWMSSVPDTIAFIPLILFNKYWGSPLISIEYSNLKNIGSLHFI